MDKICAVVVTYNRLALLKECVTSLRDQTRKLDEIIVVNNDSADGTKEWLDDQENLTVIHQANLGGAGGFYTGIKTAYEKSYDWIWCMDDDGIADINCLKNLCKYTNNEKNVIGPIIYERENYPNLAFRVPISKRSSGEINYTWDSKIVINFYSGGIIKDWVALFNGVLISSFVISKVGLPMKELFIWGDEFEYLRRMRKINCNIFSSFNAEYYHPKIKINFKRFLFDKEVIANINIDKKFYYLFRNAGFLSKKNFRFWNIRFVIAQFLYYLSYNNFTPKKSWFFLKSYIDGICTDFSNKKTSKL